MQKIRLVLRGWQRRREEHDKEFLTKNASWGTAVAPPPPIAAKTRAFAIDTEGLTVAYLDDSGQLAHFLDTEDGEIVDVRISELASRNDLRPPRYRRIPSRSEKTEPDERRAFSASLEASADRDALARSADADSFRRALAANRGIERAWYNFRNDRAIAAIEAWLSEV